MLDDILEFIVEIICDIAVVSDNKQIFIRIIGGVLLGVLICICGLLIFNGVSNNSVMLIITGSALLIALLIVLLAIANYKKNK